MPGPYDPSLYGPSLSQVLAQAPPAPPPPPMAGPPAIAGPPPAPSLSAVFPYGATPSGPTSEVRGLAPKAAQDSNVDYSMAGGSPVGALDLGLLSRRGPRGSGPDINVDLSQMRQPGLSGAMHFDNPQGSQPAPGQNYSMAGMGFGPMGGGGPARTQWMSTVNPSIEGRVLEGAGAVQGSLRNEAEGQRDLGNAEAQQAAETGAAESNAAKGIKNLAQGFEQSNMERMRSLNPILEAKNKASNEAANYHEDIDKDSHEMSFLDHARFTIASAIGGFVEGFTHGAVPNHIPAMLQKRAEMAVDAQRKEYEAKRGRVADLNSTFGQAMQLTGNAEDASKLVTMWMMDAAGRDAKAVGISTGSPVAAAKGEALGRAFETKANEYGVKTMEQLEGTQKAVQVGGGGGLTPDKIADKAAALRKEAADRGIDLPIDQARRQVLLNYTGKDFMPGAPIQSVAKSGKEGGGEASDAIRSNQEALEHLYKMRDMVSEGGKFDRARTAEGQAERAQAANAIARAETGGKRAPSEAEMHLLEAQLPNDPNALQFTGADLAKLNAVIEARENAIQRLGGKVPTRTNPSAFGFTPAGGGK